MRNKITEIVSEIDAYIRQHQWFDFRTFKYEKGNLIVVGSEDLFYYHKLEVIFHDVYFVSAYFQQWYSDVLHPVFTIPQNEIALNKFNDIEKGNQLFLFKTEGKVQDVVIAAAAVSYNTDTVFYYDRQDLKPGERVAF